MASISVSCPFSGVKSQRKPYRITLPAGATSNAVKQVANVTPLMQNCAFTPYPPGPKRCSEIVTMGMPSSMAAEHSKVKPSMEETCNTTLVALPRFWMRKAIGMPGSKLPLVG